MCCSDDSTECACFGVGSDACVYKWCLCVKAVIACTQTAALPATVRLHTIISRNSKQTDSSSFPGSRTWNGTNNEAHYQSPARASWFPMYVLHTCILPLYNHTHRACGKENEAKERQWPESRQGSLAKLRFDSHWNITTKLCSHTMIKVRKHLKQRNPGKLKLAQKCQKIV